MGTEGITIVYCAVDGCDHILASGDLSLTVGAVGHGTFARHEGGLLLRVVQASVRRSESETADDYHDALRRTYPKRLCDPSSRSR